MVSGNRGQPQHALSLRSCASELHFPSRAPLRVYSKRPSLPRTVVEHVELGPLTLLYAEG